MVCYYRFRLLVCCVMTIISLLNVQLLNAKRTGGVAILLALITAMCNSGAYLRLRRPLSTTDGERQGEGC